MVLLQHTNALYLLSMSPHVVCHVCIPSFCSDERAELRQLPTRVGRRIQQETWTSSKRLRTALLRFDKFCLQKAVISGLTAHL